MSETTKKFEILSFMESREIVTANDLMQRFGYTYSYACKRLSLLKKQGLVTILRRGEWMLTGAGYKRVHYLCRKYELLTEGEKKRWRAWSDKEREKPFEEREIWFVEADKVRMIKEGEYGATLKEAIEVMRINRGLG